MIHRGTTPTHIFNTNVDLSTASEVYITYWQKCGATFEKTLADCTIDETSVTVTLTQEDCLTLKDYQSVDIQIRAKFPDGTAIASNIMTADVGRILKGGEI